jgi:peptidylprolyl isomerase/peptidyl-prolyl cis-trans isomerase C
MIKKIIGLLVTSASICSYATDDKTLATYKGGEIKESQVFEQIKSQFEANPQLKDKKFSDLDAGIKEALVKQYLAGKLIEQEAKNSGIENSREFQQKLEDSKKVLLQTEYVESELKKQVTDNAVDSKAKEIIDSLKDKNEVKISHILVESEEIAKDIISRIKKGEKFSDLAKKYSKDAASKDKAGQVQNYLRQGAGSPKELEDKIFTMKKGESSDKPIKTDFGYHVVKIDDIRKIKAPSEREAKAQANQILRSEKLNQIIEDLNKKYDVKFLIENSQNTTVKAEEKK